MSDLDPNAKPPAPPAETEPAAVQPTASDGGPPATSPAAPVTDPCAASPASESPAVVTLTSSAPAKAQPSAPAAGLPAGGGADEGARKVDRARATVPSAPPPIPQGEVGPDGRPLVKTQMSGGTVVAADIDSGREGAAESIVNEFMDQVGNPQHPLGPFQDPQSTMIAGIEEHVGYVPGWLLVLCIIAVLLAMIMWYPSGY